MKPTVLRLYSEDLDPEESGFPVDCENYRVRFEADICDMPHDADSVFFEFYVSSPNRLAKTPDSSFMPPTLVLSEFSWEPIHSHLEKLMARGRSSKSWVELAVHWSGMLRPVSYDCFPWKK